MTRSVRGFQAKRIFAVIIFLAFATIGASSASAQATTNTITFEEFPFQPVHGLVLEGVAFEFTIGGVPSSDAYFGGTGPGSATYVEAPLLEGNSNGILSLDFATPTTLLQFGVALDDPFSVHPGLTV